MKILQIFGAVVGIHVVALLLIFANPGCSTTTKPPPAPGDTVAKAEPAPSISVPAASNTVSLPATDSPVAAAPITFNPDAPATAAPAGGGIRFMPTRPNTPAATTLVAEPVADVTPATTYTVKSGDSLWSIAAKHHLSYSDLAAANNLKANAILQPGQKLLIPAKAVPAPTAPATAPAKSTAVLTGASSSSAAPAAKPAGGDGLKHTVKAGESLSVIAKIYGVKTGDIAVANKITNPASIRPGMVLDIPGWQAAGAKAGAKATTKGAAPAPATGGAAKPAAEPAKPLFNAPGDPDSPIKAAPPAGTGSSAVPVIKVEDVPAPKKP
ncbi:MAG: LysM peptidoglycan-binding domain-containing protein [Verrucomicrobia bacterium]|nr:LysM peptidoglycan-binding domain-containing protein [Verrucomicrobiota bacterium]